MMKKNRLTLFLFFVCVHGMYSQHSNQYSQYMFNGLIINPAYAGAQDVLNATILCRNQWMGFEGAPKTASLSVHTPLSNRKLNVGINFISDNYGITHKNIVSGVFAYKINLKKSSLSFGLQGGIDATRNDWELVRTTESGDGSFPGQKERTMTPTAGVGIYYQAKKYYVGISSPSLIQAGKNTKNIYKPALLNTGMICNLSESVVIKPSVLVKYITHSPVELDINLNSYYKNAGLGFSYRTNDALVFMLHYSIRDQLCLGYAYDLTLSRMKTYNKGSHEIMLKYEFGYKVNTVGPRYF